MNIRDSKFSVEAVAKVLQEIQRRKESAKDYAGDTRLMDVRDVDGELVLALKETGPFVGFTRNGSRQLAQALQIPTPFFDRLAENEKHRGQLAQLATHLLHTEPKKRLVRTLDNRARAFLSDRYRMLDNFDLFMLSVEQFEKAGAEIWDAHLTDDHFRLYAVAPGTTGMVAGKLDGGDHTFADVTDGGDEHIAAIQITNSETGLGALRVRPCSLRSVCSNWCVMDQSLAKIHLGRQRDEEGWISDETKKADDHVTWRKVRDIIRTAFDPEKFQEIIAQLNGAKKEDTPEPLKAIDAAVEFLGLPKDSLDKIREKYLGDRDYTRYGILQAVTFQTHGAATDSERMDFEDAGAKVLATPLAQLVKIPAGK